jgi:hypothetical protein
VRPTNRPVVTWEAMAALVSRAPVLRRRSAERRTRLWI